MARHTDVPFHAAAEPGVTERQIACPDHIVGIEQVFTPAFIRQGPQPSSQGGKKFRPEKLVLQYGDFQRLQGELPVVEVLLAVGEDGGNIPIPDKEPGVRRQGGTVLIRLDVDIPQDSGNRGLGGEVGHGNLPFFKGECGHDAPSLSLSGGMWRPVITIPT